MGFFDFLKGKSNPPPRGGSVPPGPSDRKVAGFAKVAQNKNAQTYDRIEALQALAEMRSPEAAAALLPRFRFSIDPSITDQDEKEITFAGMVAAGKNCVEAIADYCKQAEAKAWPLTWPLKVLREVLDDDDYREELIELLANFDTEYARNVDPKLQILLALEELKHEDVRTTVEPFLEDVNETIRFTAVQATFNQEDDKCVDSLLNLLCTEESVRVKNKVCDGLTSRGWLIPEGRRAEVGKALYDTSGFSLDSTGKLTKVDQPDDY